MPDLRDFAQQPLMQALAWTLIHFVWQGALLGLFAFAALRIAKPERAATRYTIGVATLCAMLVTAVATFTAIARHPMAPSIASSIAAKSVPNAVGESTATVSPNERVNDAGPQSTGATTTSVERGWRFASLGPNALVVVVIAWALGVLALSIRLLGGWMLTRRLANGGIAAVSPAVDAAARLIAGRLQLRHAVSIVESGAVVVPTLVGWVKPVVLLPAAALAGLSTEQLQAILAHELAHVRRHDYLINLLQSIVETLLFYHPATWWVSAQVRAEREHCCDDLAVEACGDRLVYVSALAELTSIAGRRRLALAATDGSLVGRVQRILGRPRAMHEPTPAWALVALFVLIAGGAGSFRSATATEAAVIPKAKPAPTTPARPKARVATEAPKPAEHSANSITSPATPTPLLATRPLTEVLAPLPVSPPSSAPDLSAQDLGGRGSGNMTLDDNGDRVIMKWNGTFRLTDDEKDVAWVEDGASLSISDGVLLASKVELRGVNGRVERTFSRNGFRREWEPEGRNFLAAALDKLIRHSAAFARERVARFLKQGGPDAVLAEISRLGASSYVRRVYYTELATQAQLSESLLGRILQRAPAELSSDYDKATLFIALAKQPAIADAHRVSIARAVKTITSDHDQRRTLVTIMDADPLSPTVAAAVLDTVETVRSNYDRAELLTAVAQRGGLSPATSAAFMALVRSTGSSYDQRRVLSAVAAQGSLPDAVTLEAIRSAGAISSAHDQAETLIKLIDRGGISDASADHFFQAISQITSSHDLTRVLKRVIDRGALSDRVLEGVLRTTAKVSSSHERANLLETIAGRAKVAGAARELFLSAARGLGSHDENRALASLVRAEVRQ